MDSTLLINRRSFAFSSQAIFTPPAVGFIESRFPTKAQRRTFHSTVSSTRLLHFCLPMEKRKTMDQPAQCMRKMFTCKHNYKTLQVELSTN